jgi:hypothetical protein
MTSCPHCDVLAKNPTANDIHPALKRRKVIVRKEGTYETYHCDDCASKWERIPKPTGEEPARSRWRIQVAPDELVAGRPLGTGPDVLEHALGSWPGRATLDPAPWSNR